MSILSNIFSKIFGRDKPTQDIPVGRVIVPPKTSAAPPAPTPATPAPAPAAAPNPAAISEVDVEAVLNSLAQKNPQKLNWRTSIVDLMKLLGMESTLAERKELASELGYTGDTSDSAKMNIWLHSQVMKKLAANGGKVPADLLD